MLCLLVFMLYFSIKNSKGLVPSKDMQTPSPQMWSDFNEWCGMCWIERKINFSIYIFLSYEWKFVENWPYFEYKNDHNSKNKNRKNLIHDFYFDSAHSASFMYIWPLLNKKRLISIPMHAKQWRDYSDMPFTLTYSD